MKAKAATAPAELGATQRKCAAQLFGLWAIVPERLDEMVGAVKAGTVQPEPPQPDGTTPRGEPKLYAVAGDTAIIPINGPMTKHDHSFQSVFGGTSTTRTRRAVRQAAADASIEKILLHIDSPGGSVAGTADLADDVREAGRSKRVVAHIDDIGASAAYWVASQAERVYVNQTGMAGSIGVFTVLHDSSGMYAEAGIKTHVIATGAFKGAGVDGAPITDEQLADVRREVDEINERFVAAVASGRGVSTEKVMGELADGRVHVGQHAVDMGLADRVQSLDQTLQETQEMKTVPDQFAADNPDAVADWKNEGFTEGHTEGFDEGAKSERERFDALHKKYAGRPAFVVAQFAAGHDLGKAAQAYADVLESEAAEKDKRIKALESGQQAGVTIVPDDPTADAAREAAEAGGDKPNESDPEALAAWEWKHDPTLAQKFSSQERYTIIRKQEISGMLRTQKRRAG